MRVVPYVIGWLWNTSHRKLSDRRCGAQRGLVHGVGDIVAVTYAGSPELSAAMCPATQLWRRKMLDLANGTGWEVRGGRHLF